MNIETGELRSENEVRQLPLKEQRKYVPVIRELTRHEEARRKLAMYSLCGCGSGMKFKFCCHRKP